eukprot:jgi/Mesvir1/17285/Mv26423-RA.1
MVARAILGSNVSRWSIWLLPYNKHASAGMPQIFSPTGDSSAPTKPALVIGGQGVHHVTSGTSSKCPYIRNERPFTACMRGKCLHPWHIRPYPGLAPHLAYLCRQNNT